MFADTHVHPLMKYVHDENDDVWKSYTAGLNPLGFLNNFFGIPVFSQADFRRMAMGNVQLMFCALHPPEQRIVLHRFVKSNFEPKFEKIAAQIISIPTDKIDDYQSENYDHWELLKNEMALLMGQMGSSAQVFIKNKTRRASYRLVRNFPELKQIVDFNRDQSNEHVIAVLPTIEGLHALGRGHVNFKDSPPNDNNVSEEKFLKRLDVVKGVSNSEGQGWTFTPVVANLTHAFDNGICGHAQALSQLFHMIFDYAEPYGPQNGPQHVEGLNKGLSNFGVQVVNKMLGLDGSAGKRIIPDIKHMSVRTRKEYYEIIDQHNSNSPNDQVPVIMSHAACNGKAGLTDDLDPSDTEREYLDSDVFNPWSINLFDDEIVRIDQTKGLIGLIFDERVLTGKAQLNRTKEEAGDAVNAKRAWAKQFARHIKHILEVVASSGTSIPETAWDIICIGSDFDGQINPVDGFKKSSQFPLFRRHLIKCIKDNEFDALRYGQSARFLADKICFWNVYHFLERNFQ